MKLLVSFFSSVLGKVCRKRDNLHTKRPCNRYIITWMLHHIFMHSDKVMLADGTNNATSNPPPNSISFPLTGWANKAIDIRKLNWRQNFPCHNLISKHNISIGIAKKVDLTMITLHQWYLTFVCVPDKNKCSTLQSSQTFCLFECIFLIRGYIGRNNLPNIASFIGQFVHQVEDSWMG